MAYDFDAFVDALAKEKGISRGDAIRQLKAFRESTDPRNKAVTDQIQDIDYRLGESLVAQLPAPITQFGINYVSPWARLGATALMPFMGKGPLESVERFESLAPTSGPKVPLLPEALGGGMPVASFLGNLAGFTKPFRLVEHLVEKPITMYASRKLPASLLEAMLEGSPEAIGGTLSAADKAAIKSMDRLVGIATPAVSAAIIGAGTDPRNPVLGALSGAAIGGTMGYLGNVMAKPIPALRNNPEMGRVIKALARWYHMDEGATWEKYKTAADVQAEVANLASKGANIQPLDPMKLHDPQEWDTIMAKGGGVPPSTAFKPESTRDLYYPNKYAGGGVYGGPLPARGEALPEKAPSGLLSTTPRGEPYRPEMTPEGRGVLWSEAELAQKRAEEAKRTGVSAQHAPDWVSEFAPEYKGIRFKEGRAPKLGEAPPGVEKVPVEEELLSPSLYAAPKPSPEVEAAVTNRLTRKEPFSFTKAKDRLDQITNPLNPAVGKPLNDAYTQELEGIRRELDGLSKSRQKAKDAFRTRRLLYSQRGAIGEAPPTKGAKRRPLDITDIRDIVGAMDIDPDTVIGNSPVRHVPEELARAGWAKIFDLPAAVLSKTAASAGWIKRFYANQSHFMFNLRTRFDTTAAKLDLKHRISETPEREAEFHKANQGLASEVTFEDGVPRITYRQTQDVAPWADAAAREWQERVPRKLFHIAAGYKPEAEMIVKALGIGPDKRGSFGRYMKKLQDIQQGNFTGQIAPVDAEAARLTEGLINMSPSHDLSVQPYDEGVWSLLPIPHEKRVLAGQIADLERALELAKAGGVQGARNPVEMIAELKGKKARLQELEEGLASKGKAARPGETILPGRQWYSPLNQVRDPLAAEFQFDTGYGSLNSRLIHNILHKRFMDDALWDAKDVMGRMNDDGSVRKYLVDYLQSMRGIKAYYNDAWIRNLAARFKRRGINIDEPTIRLITADIMKFQVLTRLFMSLRFPIVNATQPLISLFPVVSSESFFRAFGKTAADLLQLRELQNRVKAGEKFSVADLRKYANNSWVRAAKIGALDEGGERFARESKGIETAIGQDKITKGLDWALEHFPTAKLGDWTEKHNRVWAFNAGVMEYGRPDFKVHSTMAPFFAPEGGEALGKGSLRARERYGLATVKGTQYILSKQGKPLIGQGGAFQQLGFQFKAFGVGYTRQAISAIQNKEWMTLAKMAISLGIVGGPMSIPGYAALRNLGIRYGGFALPESNGFGRIYEMAGLGSSPLDVTGSMDPLNLPFEFTEKAVLQNIAGPTFGPALDMLFKGVNEGPTSKAFGRAVANAILPPGVAAAQGILGLQRGGKIFTESGKTQLGTATPAEDVFRMIGLRPKKESGYYDHYRNIENAMAGGHESLMWDFVRQAQADGYIISDKTLSQIRAKIKKDEGKLIRTMGDIFSPGGE